jgi:phage terminase small subunit
MTKRRSRDIHRLTGSLRHDRERIEPNSQPEPLMPTWLGERGAQLWRKHAPALAELGLLTTLDCEGFAVWCSTQSLIETAITAGRTPARDLLLAVGSIRFGSRKPLAHSRSATDSAAESLSIRRCLTIPSWRTQTCSNVRASYAIPMHKSVDHRAGRSRRVGPRAGTYASLPNSRSWPELSGRVPYEDEALAAPSAH